MKISDFTFDLPQELIAQTPSDRRGNDRLLLIDRKTGEYSDSMFSEFPSYLEEGSLVVINDTRVRKARVYGISETGGKVEFLFTGEVEASSCKSGSSSGFDASCSSDSSDSSGDVCCSSDSGDSVSSDVAGELSASRNAGASGDACCSSGSGSSVSSDVSGDLGASRNDVNCNEAAAEIAGSPAGCKNSRWQAMVSKSKKQKVGKKYTFYTPSGDVYCCGEIESNIDDGDSGSSLKVVRFDRVIGEDFFLVCGHVPLPPYIKREDDFNDETRYQTIYADKCGSMAAPTAGLHFTEKTLEELAAKNIEVVHVTLQVGMGTFLPVRTENLEDHVMHTEAYWISEEAANKINKAKADGRKVVAIGTTSVRTLESAGRSGRVVAGSSSTNLFITPGFEFRIVDQLVTNFHTPESTLLVLVSAFSSRENVLAAYNHAVKEKYRFFSYGDACFFH